MKNIGTQVLETERLILRPFVVNDAQAMFDNWAKSEHATRYVTWDPYTDAKEAVDRFEKMQKEYAEKDIYDWAIVLKESNTLIGEISFVGMTPCRKTGELGYIIGENWWGKGYMTEAVGAVMAFGFTKLGLHRIQACHDVRNPASGRVMEKLGMTHEGTFRDYRLIKGDLVTVDYYAILEDEFHPDQTK